jgi:glycosyltransferase involved in cell wall biosynthesis
VRVSVIVPTYNRPECLELTLRSLAKQDASTDDFEVIICDDGSEGTESISIIKEYEKLLNIQYYYQTDRGFRVSKARNKGLDLAEHEIAAFVDSGMILSTNCISSIIKSYRYAKDIAIIGYSYGMDPDPITAELAAACKSSENPAQLLNDQLMNAFPDRRVKLYEQFNYDFDHVPAPWLYYWTALTTAPVSISKEIGGFDETFTQWGNEDLEFAYKLHKRGVKFQVNQGVRGLHYPHKISYIRDEKPNWDIFYDKYRTVDLELKFSVRSKDYQIELKNLVVLSKKKQIYYNSLFSILTINLPDSASLAMFGGLLSQNCRMNLTVFDYSLERMIDHSAQFPNIRFIHGIGTKTNKINQEYHVSVVGELVEGFHRQVIINIVREAIRISMVTYFISTLNLHTLQALLSEFTVIDIAKMDERTIYKVETVSLY